MTTEKIPAPHDQCATCSHLRQDHDAQGRYCFAEMFLSKARCSCEEFRDAPTEAQAIYGGSAGAGKPSHLYPKVKR
jgi:hypothetical protein